MPLCHQALSPYNHCLSPHHRDAARLPRLPTLPLHPIGCIRCVVKGSRARERGGKKEKERQEDAGERWTDRREGGTTREREKERARLFADAAESTTGGGGLTAPLHIHPRYIDLLPVLRTRRRASPHLTAPLVTGGEPAREPGARSVASRRCRALLRCCSAGVRVRDSARLAGWHSPVVVVMQSYKSDSRGCAIVPDKTRPRRCI